MEIDIIMKLGFFLSDLQHHLIQLHSEQEAENIHSDSFIVYRGQSLSKSDFDQLIKTKGGLLSFNNFLSTTKNRQASLKFDSHTMNTSDFVNILFVITIDSFVSSTPFVHVRDVNCHLTEEEEVLFSMQSIFRIGQIKEISDSNCFWQVDLTLTGDDDPQVNALTELIREEVFSISQGWNRLGMLLTRQGQFDKAQQLYDILLDQASNDIEEARVYHMLGCMKHNQGEYTESIKLYKKVIEIRQKTLPMDHIDLSSSYTNIGVVYSDWGNYTKALLYHEKALSIAQNTLPPNHPGLVVSYNNIAVIHFKMGEYTKALSSFEKNV